MRVRIKGYFDNSTFDLAPVKNNGKRGCKYVRFRSDENIKRIFNFYKNEMQQGEKPEGANLGRSHIAATGFFESGGKHWNEFKTYIPKVVYRFTLINDTLLEIEPVKDSSEIEDIKIFDL